MGTTNNIDQSGEGNQAQIGDTRTDSKVSTWLIWGLVILGLAAIGTAVRVAFFSGEVEVRETE